MARRDYEGMIEQQQAEALRLMGDQNSAWYGLPYDVVEYFTTNSPFGLDARGWEPGREVSQQEVGEMLWRMNLPDLSEDFDAGTMDINRYLSDPRSVLAVEDGKFIYRPEQTYQDGRVRDFRSKNRESTWEEWAPVLANVMPWLGPYMASLGAVAGAGTGAAGAGAAGAEAGIGALNSFDLGSMAEILGTNIGAEAGSFNFLDTFNELTNFPTGGGQLGGTVSPTADIADMITTISGGGDVSVGGLGGVTDTTLGLPAGGVDAILGGTGVTVPGPLGNLTLDPTGNLVTEVVGGASQDLVTKVPGGGSIDSGGGNTTGGITDPIKKIVDAITGGDSDWAKLIATLLAGGLGVYGADKQSDAFSDLANKYLNLGAPARARLEQSYADPMSFLNGPDVQSITQQGSNAAARSLSTQYGNPAMSPNAWAEINRINTGNQWNQLSNYRNQLAAQGGLGIAPGAQFDANSVQSGGQGYNIAGALLGDITNPRKSMLEQMQELAGLYGDRNLFGGSVIRP